MMETIKPAFAFAFGLMLAGCRYEGESEPAPEAPDEGISEQELFACGNGFIHYYSWQCDWRRSRWELVHVGQQYRTCSAIGQLEGRTGECVVQQLTVCGGSNPTNPPRCAYTACPKQPASVCGIRTPTLEPPVRSP